MNNTLKLLAVFGLIAGLSACGGDVFTGSGEARSSTGPGQSALFPEKPAGGQHGEDSQDTGWATPKFD